MPAEIEAAHEQELLDQICRLVIDLPEEPDTADRQEFMRRVCDAMRDNGWPMPEDMSDTGRQAFYRDEVPYEGIDLADLSPGQRIYCIALGAPDLATPVWTDMIVECVRDAPEGDDTGFAGTVCAIWNGNRNL